MEFKQEISSLKNKVIKIEEENKILKEENKKIKDQNESSKKLCDEKIKRLRINHKNSTIYLERQLLKEKQNLELLKSNMNERYNQLDGKMSSLKMTNKTLKDENEEKTKEIVKLNNDKKTLNIKLDSIGCRTLSKALIDFLYFVFTSNFKGNSYLDEKNSIIEVIEIKKANEFNFKKIC